MTPEQALNLLDQASRKVNTNRETHEALSQAVLVLRDILNPNKQNN